MLLNPDRQMKYVTYAAASSLSAAIVLAAWGVAVEPRLIDRREEIGEVPGLPAAWEGRRIALLADPQVGIWLSNTSTVRRLVGQVLAERPALVLIAGDFVYEAARDPGRAIGAAVELVAPLPAARIPTYAVLGNHDYAVESAESTTQQHQVARELRRALEESGVRVLHNEAVALPPPDDADRTAGDSDQEEPLYLVGIGSHVAGEDRPLRAVRQVPSEAPRLAFMHNPASFPALPPGSAPLAMAGHTHGGQIRVPFKPEWTLARLIKRWPEYADGWIDGYGQPGNHLYVNRGIGFSFVPVRLGCPPELTLFTLRAARP